MNTESKDKASGAIVSLAERQNPKPNDNVVRRLELILEEARAGKIQGFGMVCCQRGAVDSCYWIVGNFDSWYNVIGACRVMSQEFEREAMQGTVFMDPDADKPENEEDE